MSDILQHQTIETFFDNLASRAPTPGGGSVAAYTGAMAAGLVSMVCAIILNRERTTGNTAELQSIHSQAEAARQELQQLAQEDVAAFERLAAAYKLPRTTDADAANRRAAIQRITREAADVPLRTAHTASRLLPLCTTLVQRTDRILVSDVGIAATLIRSAVRSALLNVEINLVTLEDKNYVRGVRLQMEDLTVGLDEAIEGVMEIVHDRINQ